MQNLEALKPVITSDNFKPAVAGLFETVSWHLEVSEEWEEMFLSKLEPVIHQYGLEPSAAESLQHSFDQAQASDTKENKIFHISNGLFTLCLNAPGLKFDVEPAADAMMHLIEATSSDFELDHAAKAIADFYGLIYNVDPQKLSLAAGFRARALKTFAELKQEENTNLSDQRWKEIEPNLINFYSGLRATAVEANA